MILYVNRQLAYALVRTAGLWMLLSFVFYTKTAAQDTVLFRDVEISAKKIELSQIGKKTDWIDTTVKEQFRYASLADLLSYNSPVFIKSYGPGGIATTAFRGANAAQTAVLWNGFNLQNAMLAQTDLALLPAVLFEDIGVEYGGSSSLWGSGAIGGAIHLNNTNSFNQGGRTAVNAGAGSFGAFNGSASVLLSRSKFISSTKLYSNSSKNDFSYKDEQDEYNPIKRQRDAGFHFKGLMQEFKFLLNPKQFISVNAWLTDNQRNLPGYNENYDSKASQRDKAMRLTTNWSYVNRNMKSLIRAACFLDAIDYEDSRIRLESKSRVISTMLENENHFQIRRWYQLNLALNALSSSAVTENYASRKSINRASFLFGNKFSFFNDRLVSYISARLEYISVGALPLTGNVSLEYKLLKQVTVKLNTARVYRQPSLNELYWLPGGNINLKPEQGYTYEGEIQYNKQIRRISVILSGSAYSRKIENWILWVPGTNGTPSPVNIQNVWSRGTETSWKLRYTGKKFRAGATMQSGYVLSTVISNTRQNDNSIDKQLIYTPRYTFNSNLIAGYKFTDLVVYHQYNGYRFTTSDNLNWLLPYHVVSVRVNQLVVLKNIKFTLFAACNNVMNQDYEIMAGRPMPLRSYECGVSIQTKNKNQNK